MDRRAREKDHSGESAVVQQDVLTSEIAQGKSVVVQQFIFPFGHSYKKTILAVTRFKKLKENKNKSKKLFKKEKQARTNPRWKNEELKG